MATVKAASLLLDYNIYPRNHLDRQNVRDLRRALRAGNELLPVIADKASKRVVDGFHRITATLEERGENATIGVQWESYKGEKEIFIASIVHNSGHGQKLTPWDTARCITRGEDLKLEPAELAYALRMTIEDLSEIRMRKTATHKGELTPIKNSVRHLAGKSMTAKQMAGHAHALGTHQLFLVNQIINLLEHDLLDEDNERLIERLGDLYSLLAARHRKAKAS